MNLNRRTFFGWIASVCATIRGIAPVSATSKSESSHSVSNPIPELQSSLKKDFSRNEKDFAVNKYCQIVPVSQALGVWWQQQLQHSTWMEIGFKCLRRSYTDTVLDDAGVMERSARSIAQKAMAFRVISVINCLTDPTQYHNSHAMNVARHSAFCKNGDWKESTTARMTINSHLDHAIERIIVDGQHAVKAKELMLVMNPATAASISASQEIQAAIREGKCGEVNSDGVPCSIYGLDVVTEDTVVVISQRGLGVTPGFAMPNGSVLLLHRSSDLVGVEGDRSFSTVSIQVVEDDEMRVSIEGGKVSVSDSICVTMTSPVNGFLFLNVC